MSLPKQHRLKKDQDVQAVFDEGEFYKGKYCHLFVLENPDSPLRATFIVSQKTARLATERNRIKRLLRESFRLRLDKLEPGHDLTILATRIAHGELKRQDIDDDLGALLCKANLLEKTMKEPTTSNGDPA